MKFRPVVTLHLALYNQVQSIGWLFILLFLSVTGFANAWDSLRTLVIGLQCLVLLDIIHAFLGLWPHQPLVSIWQRLWCKVGHRTEIFISISMASTAALNSRAFGFMLFTWALADFARFQFYFLRTVDWPVPRWLYWLRYSMFIPQYPLVVISEAWFVGVVHLSSKGIARMFAVGAATNVIISQLKHQQHAIHGENLRWTAIGAMLTALSVPLFDINLTRYACVAMFFQLRQWIIFLPSYWMLWNVRGRKLGGGGAKANPSRSESNSNDLSSIEIKPAGPEADSVVVSHWKRMWLETVAKEENLRPNFDALTQGFIENARDVLDYQTFIAVDSSKGAGEIVASVACQTWAGPMPLIVKPKKQKFGSVWAVYVRPEYRRRGIAQAMMEKVKEHWRSCGCNRGLLIFASADGQRVYERVGFKKGNMMLYDFPKDYESALQTRIESADASLDALVLDNMRKMWLEQGIPEHGFQADIDFVTNARANLSFQGFVVRSEAGDVVASVASNLWSGPLPCVLLDSVFKLGTLWGLYVEPEFRGQGLEEQLLKRCISHWHELGCTRGISLMSSDEVDTFKSVGFTHSNAMSIDLERTKQDKLEVLRDEGVVGNDEWLSLLLLALPQQLKAAFGSDTEGRALCEKVWAAQRRLGLFIDPENNSFTRNIRRMGGNFDMGSLKKNPALLSQKFDKLAPRYDVWTVGNQSKVERWIVKQARAFPSLARPNVSILDCACGIGLMAHQLRLCGWKGNFTGMDISPSMIAEAQSRNVYQSTAICDVNLGVPSTIDPVDLIICTGAMELLDQPVVLKQFCKALKSKGYLWASFQAEIPPTGIQACMDWTHPTLHQNIKGITQQQLTTLMNDAGFDIMDVEIEAAAFLTPSPRQDGSLLPVPYFFVNARKQN